MLQDTVQKHIYNKLMQLQHLSLTSLLLTVALSLLWVWHCCLSFVNTNSRYHPWGSSFRLSSTCCWCSSSWNGDGSDDSDDDHESDDVDDDADGGDAVAIDDGDKDDNSVRVMGLLVNGPAKIGASMGLRVRTRLWNGLGSTPRTGMALRFCQLGRWF